MTNDNSENFADHFCEKAFPTINQSSDARGIPLVKA